MFEIPVVLKQQHGTMPQLSTDQSRYVVGDNGVFLEYRGRVYSCCTEVPRESVPLETQQPYCRLYCGRLPRIMQRVMLGFFRGAHELHGGEAALVLLYHPQRRVFQWHCPPQTIDLVFFDGRWSACDYIQFENPLELPAGYVQLGDAHLHPGPPVPSAMDVADDEDGLHIIVGNIRQQPTYHIDFVAQGTRFRVPPAQILADLDCPPTERVPTKWLEQIYLRRKP